MKQALIAAWLFAALPVAAQAQSTAPAAFDWRKYDGQTVRVLLNNFSWTQALQKYRNEFTQITGIKLQLETFSEEQFRTRLSTILQAKSSDVDVYMTLPSREGALYEQNGWYVDLSPALKSAAAPDYDYQDFGKALRDSGVGASGAIVSVPINVEGPLFYWRTDIFQKCNIGKPETLEELPATAAKLKLCDPSVTPWAARALRGTVGYPLGGFIYNEGGDFKDTAGKATLCLPGTIKGIGLYGDMLRQYGPPGATNHTFTQVIELLGQGRVAMTNESSGEFTTLMRFPGRDSDIGVALLPKGAQTGISKPIAINWSLAISPYSKSQDAAWYFVQWATGKDIQAKLASTGIAPSRVSVFNGPALGDWSGRSRPRQEWVKALAEAAQTGTSVYLTPTARAPEAREILSSVVQQVVLGEADAKDAACAVTGQLQALQ